MALYQHRTLEREARDTQGLQEFHKALIVLKYSFVEKSFLQAQTRQDSRERPGMPQAGEREIRRLPALPCLIAEETESYAGDSQKKQPGSPENIGSQSYQSCHQEKRGERISEKKERTAEENQQEYGNPEDNDPETHQHTKKAREEIL